LIRALRNVLALAAVACWVFSMFNRAEGGSPSRPLTAAVLVLFGLNALVFARTNADDVGRGSVEVGTWAYRLIGSIFVTIGTLFWLGMIRMKGFPD
jgi:hypothetical protein